MAFIKNKFTQLTSGNQTISGNKTLNDSIFLNSGLVFLRLGGGNEDVDIDLLSRPFSNTRVSIGTETGILGQSINTSNFEREIKIWETGGFGGFYGPFVRIGRSGVLISEKTESKVGIGTLYPTEKVDIRGGNLRVENNVQVYGTGIFNALDINNIDNLSISGVDITITSGNVSLTNPVSAPNLIYNTGNQTISGVKTFVDDIKISGSNFTLTNSNINFSGNNINFENQNNINLAYQFPAYTGIRRYSPLDFYNATTTNGAVVSGAVNYFPFLIKKKVTDPKACIDMVLYAANDAKVVIGIYSGNYGFENAKLITSGFINGNSLNTGIYRTTLNGTFNQGPYILASMLETGAGSTFRVIGSNGFREHFGTNTGSNVLHGVNSAALTNVIADTGVSALPLNISSATWYANTSTNCSPLVFLEY